ncbi:D-2-hydroxyacid dehydrogenase [Archangium violaceum]|uniref:D-2-hydroxyacid dehydrogenase n=1 Tax=Archangium violaceum TaxID=83451 RepID=UPI0036DEDBF5
MKIDQLLVLGDPSWPYLRALEGLSPRITVTTGLTEDVLGEAAERAQVFFVCTPRQDVLRSLWRRARHLRWVHSLSAGVDHLLFDELVHSPLPLTNAKGVYSGALGEFALMAMLFFAKDAHRMLRQQAEARWEKFEPAELRGQTLGILGYGDIGRAAAQRARAFGMRVLACRRRPELSAGDALVDEVFPLERRHELFAASDYVLLAMPDTPGTQRLVGEAELRALAPQAVLINVGRGGTVDEPALVRALQERRLRGAALDVFEHEPLPASHPLWRLDNVLLSPHCADNTPQWRERSVELFLRNLERFEHGEPLLNVVDKAAGY